MAKNTSNTDFEHKYREYKYISSKKDKYDFIIHQLIPYLLILVAGLIPIFLLYFTNPEDKMYGFDKASIKTKIQKTIKNGGGDLSNIKHIYDKRKISKVSSKGDDFYAQDYSLSDILYDLKIDHFNSSKDTMDTAYIDAIESLIAENNKKNPFDNLEENQRYHFQIIQEKLDSNYNKISDEMTRIADELKNKNLLVAQYLNKSESSYNISIIALFLSIAIGVTQLYQNYRASKKIKELKDKS